MCPPLDILLEYCIEHVTVGLFYVMFTFPTRIFYRGVPGFATDCPYGVWCRGLTICLQYVGPLFGNLVENDSRFVNVTLGKYIFVVSIVSHLNTLQHNTFFSFTLFSCLHYFLHFIFYIDVVLTRSMFAKSEGSSVLGFVQGIGHLAFMAAVTGISSLLFFHSTIRSITWVRYSRLTMM